MKKPIHKKIILIDNDESFINSIKSLLSKSKFNVEFFENHNSAQTYVKNNSDIQLALINIDMTDSHGLIKFSKNLIKNNNIPSIFLSGNLKETQIKKLNKIPAYGYYIKNSNLQLLHHSINLALNFSECKEREITYNDKEKKYKTYISNAPCGFFLADNEGKYKDVNDHACEMTGYSRNELLKMKIPDIASSENYNYKSINFKTLKKKGIFEDEILFNRKDGSNLPVLLKAVALSDGTYMAYCSDISSQKASEKSIENAYNEKYSLLKELQHRVKNSFSMILSMINITQSKKQSQEVKTALDEIASRIKAVAEMYNLLYESESLQNLRLHMYLANIISSISIVPGKIRIKKQLHEIIIPAKTSIPIGLITIEIITNAIKYAFRNSSNAEINIKLSKYGSFANLEIADNGKGFPFEKKIKDKDSMGLQLIENLINQIKGSYSVDTKNGTKWKIRFPIK